MQLHKLAFGGEVVLHVIHIPGTRMIECGIDGLSRGLLNKGVMQGHSLLDFIPLGKTALERRVRGLDWVLVEENKMPKVEINAGKRLV